MQKTIFGVNSISKLASNLKSQNNLVIALERHRGFVMNTLINGAWLTFTIAYS